MLIHYKIGSFLATQQRLSFQKHRNRGEGERERGKNVRHYEDRTRTSEKKIDTYKICMFFRCVN